MYGPYSWSRGFRGTLAQVTTAMGFEEGPFSYRGLTQGIPKGYGRLITSLLTAVSLHRNEGMPMISKATASADPSQAELLSRWSHHGWSRARLWPTTQAIAEAELDSALTAYAARGSRASRRPRPPVPLLPERDAARRIQRWVRRQQATTLSLGLPVPAPVAGTVEEPNSTPWEVR